MGSYIPNNPTIILFILKKSSAYYICCIYSNAFQNTFPLVANIMNPDQTAPEVKLQHSQKMGPSHIAKKVIPPTSGYTQHQTHVERETQRGGGGNGNLCLSLRCLHAS